MNNEEFARLIGIIASSGLAIVNAVVGIMHIVHGNQAKEAKNEGENVQSGK